MYRLLLMPVVEIMFRTGYKLVRLSFRQGRISFKDANAIILGMFRRSKYGR